LYLLIPAAEELKIGKITVPGKPRKKVSETSSQQNKSQISRVPNIIPAT
jgi:hypothetical protein